MAPTPRMRDGLVYLSGPITAGHGRTVADNVASALAVFDACLRAGVPAFCPHLGALDETAFDIDYETWMAYDFAVIDRCTAMLMLPHWRESRGALREREYAARLGMPVYESLEAML